MKESVVFLSGSISEKKMPLIISEWVDRYVISNCKFIVGDASGIDSVFQEYLHKKKYLSVEVFGVSDRPRNKREKKWEYIKINVPNKFKNTSRMNFLFRDFQLSKQSHGGIIVWNPIRNTRGRESVSKGSLFNMINLLSDNKSLILYYIPSNEVRLIDSLDDLFSNYIEGNKQLENAWTELKKLRSRILVEENKSNSTLNEKNSHDKINLFW